MLINANRISLFSWNLYKQQIVGWDAVLENALKTADILALQEARDQERLSVLINEYGFKTAHVVAFQYKGRSNGVMTLARVLPQLYCIQKQIEPWIRFPKSVLITTYPLTDGQFLMVANLHAINFTVGLRSYSQQLDSVFRILKLHRGPIILAGDFNTWRIGRYHSLKKYIEAIGLNEITFKDDVRTQFRGRPLDYIFARDLWVKQSNVIATSASDHNALQVVFSVERL